MGESLQVRINHLVKAIFARNDKAWILWSDPQGTWLPLLRKVSTHGSLGRFPLLEVTTQTVQGFGSPLARRCIQEHIMAHQHFVLYVTVPVAELGWLWAHALLAEERYTLLPI